ncbi:MAG: 1-deoxy-D-xylulose-5-phosphate reductoisomerase, partial [Clostridia bacterium]|nr:1-deoxy-D-xylulose-5-phosphate reductoisomerase [Clostridia bacterium]
IMHSAVEYTDHSVIAQMSVPDMRLCVQYALTHPTRTDAVIPELDLTKIASLTFRRPDARAFPLLGVATDAIRAGGAVPAVVNAANEIAVGAFLSHRIGLTDIFETVATTVSDLEKEARKETSLEGIFAFDSLARVRAKELLPNA